MANNNIMAPEDIQSIDDVIKDYDLGDSCDYATVDNSKKDFLKAYFLNSRARQAFIEEEIIVRQKHKYQDALTNGFEKEKQKIYEENLKNLPELSLFSNWKLKKSQERINAWKSLTQDEIYQFFIKQSLDQDLGGGSIAYKNEMWNTVFNLKAKAELNIAKLISKIKKKVFDESSSIIPKAGVNIDFNFAKSMLGHGNIFLWTSLPTYNGNNKVPTYLSLTGDVSSYSVNFSANIGGSVTVKSNENQNARIANLVLTNWSGMASIDLINFQGARKFFGGNYRLKGSDTKFAIPYVTSEKNTAFKNIAFNDLKKIFFEYDIMKGYSSQTDSNDMLGKFSNINTLNIRYGKAAKETASEPILRVETLEKGYKLSAVDIKKSNATIDFIKQKSEDSDDSDLSKKLAKLKEFVNKIGNDININALGDDATLANQLFPEKGSIDIFKTEVEARFSLLKSKSYSKIRYITFAVPFSKENVKEKLALQSDIQAKLDSVVNKGSGKSINDIYKGKSLKKISAELPSLNFLGANIDDLAKSNLNREEFLDKLSKKGHINRFQQGANLPAGQSLARDNDNDIDEMLGLTDIGNDENFDTVMIQNTVLNYTQDVDAAILVSPSSETSFFCSTKSSIIAGLASSTDSEKKYSKEVFNYDTDSKQEKQDLQNKIQEYFKESKDAQKFDSAKDFSLNKLLSSEPYLDIRSTNNISYISLCRLVDKDIQRHQTSCDINRSAVYFGTSINASTFKQFFDYISYYKDYLYTDSIIKYLIANLGADDKKLSELVYEFITTKTQQNLNDAYGTEYDFINLLNIVIERTLAYALEGVISLRKQKWVSHGFFKDSERTFKDWMKERLKLMDYKLYNEFVAYLGIIADYHNSKDKTPESARETALKFLALRTSFLVRFLELRKTMAKYSAEGNQLNGVTISENHLKMVSLIISYLTGFDFEKISTSIHFSDNQKELFKRFFNSSVNSCNFIGNIIDLQRASGNAAIPFIELLKYLDNPSQYEIFAATIDNITKLGLVSSLVIESCWKVNNSTIADLPIDDPAKENDEIKQKLNTLYNNLKEQKESNTLDESFIGFRVLKQEESTNSNIAKFTLGVRADISKGIVSVRAGDTTLASAKVYEILGKVGVGIDAFRKAIDCLTEATLDLEIGMTNNEERSSQGLVMLIAHSKDSSNDITNYTRPSIIL